MTMGMLLVAFFAASAADPAGATIRSTLSRTSSAARSVLDDEVLALDPAELTQLSQERLEPVLHGLTGGRAQITNVVHPARLLRLGGERRGAEGKRSKKECKARVTSVHPVSRRSSADEIARRITALRDIVGPNSFGRDEAWLPSRPA
jgi:hypothetical protein